MNIPDIIIAIDGYSSTGKSTLAKLIAEQYSFLYLDSGAMYRGVTLYAMENGLIAEDGTIDEEGLKEALKDLDLDFKATENGSATFIGDRCVEKEIRAQRRFDEMVMKGQEPVMEEVMKNLLERDYIDSHREVSPLSRAEDAYVLDNSDMTLHEETVWFQGLCQGKFGILE